MGVQRACRREGLTSYPSLWVAPNRKRSVFHLQQEDVFSSTLAGRRKIFCSPSNSLAPVNEKPLHFNLPVSSNGFFLYNSSSQLPLSSLWNVFSPLFQTCLWICVASKSQILVLCFLTQPILGSIFLMIK